MQIQRKKIDRTQIFLLRPLFVSFIWSKTDARYKDELKTSYRDIQSAGSDKENVFRTFPLKF